MNFDDLQQSMNNKYYMLHQKFSNGADYIMLAHVKKMWYGKENKHDIFGKSTIAECEIINVEVNSENDSNFYIDVDYTNTNNFRIYGVKNYFIVNGYNEISEDVWLKFKNKAKDIRKESTNFFNI